MSEVENDINNDDVKGIDDIYIYQSMSKNRTKHLVERAISIIMIFFIISVSAVAYLNSTKSEEIPLDKFEDEYLTETVFVEKWLNSYFSNDTEYIEAHTVNTVNIFVHEEKQEALNVTHIEIRKIDILDKELEFFGTFNLGNTNYSFKLTTSKKQLLVTKQIEFEELVDEKVSQEDIDIAKILEEEYSLMEPVNNADTDKIDSFLKLLFDSINTDYENAKALYPEVENPQNYSYDLESLIIIQSGLDEKGNINVLLKVKQNYNDEQVILGTVEVTIEIVFDLENKKIFSITKY